MAYRIETGRLDKAERTPQGGLRVPAAIGRSGCLEYTQADGSKRVEYRSPEEASRPESLASLRGAPVTDLHPSRPVTPETFTRVSRGHAAAGTMDGEHITTSLTVQDATLIRGIESGARKETSAGYTTDLVETPGTAPDGTPYDALQTNITYNHVALGPPGWGRAGATVALRLDSNGDAVPLEPAPPKEKKPMATERIDGVDHEVGTIPWQQARAKHDAQAEADLTKATERADKAETKLAEVTAERDEHKGRIDALETATAPEAISAAVTARVELQGKAQQVKHDIKCDGLTDRQVMVTALGVDDDDKVSDDYWRGRFDTAVEQSTKADSSLVITRALTQHTDGRQVSPVAAAMARKAERLKGAN